MERLKLDIQRFATTGTSVTPANEDGTTFYLYWRRTSYSIENNTSTIYWALAINAAYSYYSNAVKVGAVTINGQTVYGGGTFSDISRGEHALTSGTLTIQHNNDGTKSFNTSISGWTWGCSWVSKSDTFTLDTIPRYATCTQSLNSRTETSIKMNWSSDSTIDYVWYSKDNGSTWTAVGSVNAKSGTYNITGLTANTTYNIKTRVRRKDSQLTTDSTATGIATYNYPNCTSAPNFTIGNSVTLQFYNPLNRTFDIRLWSHTSQSFISDSITISGTSYTFTPDASTLYASIPNSKSSVYNVDSTYNTHKIVKTGGSYSVDENTNKPTFSDFDYEDTNTTTLALTGDSSIVVQNYSNVRANISVANKAVAKNNATMSKYNLVIGNATTSVNYSDSESVSTPSINNVSSNIINLYAEDSRGLTTLVSKTATLKAYTDIQKENISVERVGNVGTNVTLKFNGTFWNDNFGDINNSITNVSYRFKKTSDSQWTTGATAITPTINGNKYSFNGGIAGDLGNNGFSAESSFNIELTVSDELSSTTFSFVLGTGIPWIAVADDGIAINGPYNESLDPGLQVNGKLYLNDKEIDMNGDFVVNSIRTKNIFDGLLERGSFYNVDGTKIDSTSRVRSTNFMKVDSGNYTISVSNSNYYVVVYVYGIDGAWKSSESIVGWQSLPYTINIQGERKIKIALRNSAGTNITPSDVSNVMVEKGTSATTYKPYQNLDSNDYYSNVEQQIGYWIDGKPLYRKVMNVGNKPTDGTINVSNVVSNLDTLVSIRGTAYSSYWNQHYNIPNVHPDTNFYLNALLINKTDLQIRGGNGWTNYGGLTNIFVVLEYTKTTD